MVNHSIQLRGSYVTANNPQGMQPTLLQFKEQNFVDRLLSKLKTSDGRESLQDKVAEDRTDSGALRLYQPVHRLFNVLLIDAHCDQIGSPRIDHTRINSSGYVVRKVDDNGRLLGWMKHDGNIVGWKSVNSSIDYDVDPTIRQARRLGSNAAVLSKSTVSVFPQEEYEEDASSLFLTAPDIMKNAGKTYLYAALQVASNEWSESEEAAAQPSPFSKDDIKERLPTLLQKGGNSRFDSENPKPPIRTSSKKRLYATDRNDANYITLKRTLDYLANEVGLFTGGDETDDIKSALKSISISYNANYYTFLKSAYEVINGFPEDPDSDYSPATSVSLPGSWPAISTSQKKTIVNGVNESMQARWATLSPRSPRFEISDKFKVFAFIRTQESETCPVKTIWTEGTETFEIVPWYETSDLIPPTQIELPDVDRDTLSKLKPNVAFKVPESIQKIMDNLNLTDMLDGKEPKKSDWGFGMICGFSIPLITICAFIVLQIFLGLLHLAFWWLPFIKICIPFPKPK